MEIDVFPDERSIAVVLLQCACSVKHASTRVGTEVREASEATN